MNLPPQNTPLWKRPLRHDTLLVKVSSCLICFDTFKDSKTLHFVIGETPAVKAFDTFLTQSVYPLADTCDDLNDMGDMGKLLVD